MSKEDILEAIASMSVMEVVELIEAMEEKFGVTAAAADQLWREESRCYQSCSRNDRPGPQRGERVC